MGAAVVLLRLVERSSDVFPPVKAIVGGALYIIELVEVLPRSTLIVRDVDGHAR